MTYQIEGGVPIPPPGTRVRKYPFRYMAVGDSFAIEPGTHDVVRKAAYGYAIRNLTVLRFTQTASGEWRCWRVR